MQCRSLHMVIDTILIFHHYAYFQRHGIARTTDYAMTTTWKDTARYFLYIYYVITTSSPLLSDEKMCLVVNILPRKQESSVAENTHTHTIRVNLQNIQHSPFQWLHVCVCLTIENIVLEIDG